MLILYLSFTVFFSRHSVIGASSCLSDWSPHRQPIRRTSKLSSGGRALRPTPQSNTYRGRRHGLSKWAEEMLPANPDYMEAREKARNREVERFLKGPTSVKLDDAGSLYIVDSCRYRLQIYRRVY